MLMETLLASTLVLGDMNQVGDSDRFCRNVQPHSTVIVDSGGGLVYEFMKVGDCFYYKEVNVIVKKAVSAAGYILTSPKTLCYYEDSVVALHTPFNPDGSRSYVNEIRDIFYYINAFLSKWGATRDQVVYLNWLSLMARDKEYFVFKGEDIKGFTKNGKLCEGGYVE